MNNAESVQSPLLPLKIIATDVALPSQKVLSSEIDQRLGLAVGYTQKLSGIEYRFHATSTESQAQLAAQAITRCCTSANIEPESIDLLISACAVPVQALPCTAAHILQASPLKDGLACFDINASCVSFITALQVAASLLNTSHYKRICIVSADLASRGIDWQHEESSMIFGDGAACVIVERGNGTSGIVSQRFETYTEGLHYCEIPAGGTLRNPRSGMCEQDFLFHMDGKRVFRLASSLVEGYMQRLLEGANISLDQIATIIPHQASHLSLAHMRKRLAVNPEILIDIYRYHGNQVAASLPFALHSARLEQRLVTGKPALLIGTAAGLTFGGMVFIP